MSEILMDLAGVNAKLRVMGGRVSGSVYIVRPWSYVQFRGGQDESIEATLCRALAELKRRAVVGMPRTTQTAPASQRIDARMA